MYEKWAEDYYKDYKELPLVYRSEDAINKTKSIIDLISRIKVNFTSVSVPDSFGRKLKETAVATIAVMGAIFLTCCIICVFHVKRKKKLLYKRIGYEKLARADSFLKSFQHGKYVHPGGLIEEYTPTEDEEKAYIDAYRKMNRLRTELT